MGRRGFTRLLPRRFGNRTGGGGRLPLHANLGVSVHGCHDLVPIGLEDRRVGTCIRLTSVRRGDLLLERSRGASRPVLRRGQLRHWVVAVQVHDRRVNEGRNRHGEDRARDARDR